MIEATGMPAPGWPDDEDPLRADEDLGPPAVTELADVVDPAADRDEPPDMRVGERAVDDQRRGGRPRPEPLDSETARSRGAPYAVPIRPTTRTRRRPPAPATSFGKQHLDGRGRVLDHDPSAGRVEQGGTGGDDRLDRDVTVGRP